MVGRTSDPGEHHLGHVDPEQVERPGRRLRQRPEEPPPGCLAAAVTALVSLLQNLASFLPPDPTQTTLK